ncbi:hypothetical protein PVIIG_00917 [Plasmodium vivax India VII]|uniref:Polyubiquitin binding protein n=1 Tax=Plasmodium vivax India VII TaxID=1077284 RepID=A0A0J9V192_PLAVI|nr:hypothetical protein PVIIG_00917 [Plasmodium vivax India VII]
MEEFKECHLSFDYIVSADMTGAIMVWKRKTGEETPTGESPPPDENPHSDVETFPLHLSDNYQLYKKIEIHERFVYAMTHSKYVGISELTKCTGENLEDHLHVYSGGSDKGVYLFNLNGYIELMLQGHKNSVSSIVEYSEHILLSADWNGDVIMWRIFKLGEESLEGRHLESPPPSSAHADKENNPLCGNKYTYSIVKILNNHKYATYVNCLNEFILTISQNNIVTVWNSEGEKTDEIKNIHNDSVRDIVLFNGKKNAITFSNDETIIIYDSNFNMLKMYRGHQGFIFHVCVNEEEQLMYSCGDDKSIKVWCIKDIYQLMEKYETGGGAILHKLPLASQEKGDPACLQTIYLTDTLWSVKVLSNGDLACACNDSYIRVYTKKRNHKLKEEATKEVLEMCSKRNKKESPNGENANSTGGGNQPENIISVENIKSVVGKEGEVKIFKNKEKYEAYKYENNQWVLIGEVVDDSTSQKKFYIGDNLFQQGYYDEVVSIDTGYGNIKLLPYNASDNVHIIAEMFCKREGLSASQIKPIVDFINQNYASKGGSSTSAGGTNSCFATHNGGTPYGGKKFNTVLNVFTVEKAALDKIFQKIQEFNSLQGGEEKNTCKLSNEQVNALSNIINLYKKNLKNVYSFNTADINLIMTLFNWSPTHIFPVIDLFRVLVLNKNCDFLYNNKYSFNGFKLVYDCVAYYIANSSKFPENEENKLDSLLLCCLRFYLNMFSLSTPRFYMYKKLNFVAKQLAEVKSANFNINTLCMKIFFNYVITLNENNDQAMRKSVFDVLHSIKHKINDIELLYIFALCFHTSHEMNTKETNEIVKKFGSLDFMKNKLGSLLPHKSEQNEKVFKNVGSILEDLSA